MHPVSRRLLASVTLVALTLPLLAQQGAVSFKNFHRYPASGQWTTEGYTTLGGKPMAAPETSTACASPLNAARLAAVKKMGNDAAPTCKITVLRDEEHTAEYEQVCTAPRQTIHSIMHAVDDTTIVMETRFPTPDGSDIVTHTTSHFLGACTAEQAAEAAAASNAPLPSMKPNAEACAGVPDMRTQAEEGLKGCDTATDFSEGERTTCRSTMSGMIERVKVLERSCAK